MADDACSPANRASGIDAFAAAAGGALCVRIRRLPRELSDLVARLQSTDDVVFIVCIKHDDASPLLVRPAPIRVPRLADRARELPRIIDEYAYDAVAELGATRTGFSDTGHAWVREHAAATLTEIEKAPLRLVALRASGRACGAAARRGRAPVSLLQWFERRKALTYVSR